MAVFLLIEQLLPLTLVMILINVVCFLVMLHIPETCCFERQHEIAGDGRPKSLKPACVGLNIDDGLRESTPARCFCLFSCCLCRCVYSFCRRSEQMWQTPANGAFRCIWTLHTRSTDSETMFSLLPCWWRIFECDCSQQIDVFSSEAVLSCCSSGLISPRVLFCLLCCQCVISRCCW